MCPGPCSLSSALTDLSLVPAAMVRPGLYLSHARDHWVTCDIPISYQWNFWKNRLAFLSLLHVSLQLQDMTLKLQKANCGLEHRSWLEQRWLERQRQSCTWCTQRTHDTCAHFPLEQSRRAGTVLHMVHRVNTQHVYTLPLTVWSCSFKFFSQEMELFSMLALVSNYNS